MKVIFLCLLVFMPLFSAKEIFLSKHISLYVNDTNPYYYKEIAREYVSEKEEMIYKGALDTKLNMHYDEKKYPTTKGTFKQVGLLKPIGNGMEFSLSYRNAQGTQEYNNIKTGKEGEVLSAIKIPVFSVLANSSANQTKIDIAKINTKNLHQKAKEGILQLRFDVHQAYYALLLQKSLLEAEKKLLQKTKKNSYFVSKEISIGKLPEVAKIEIESQIIARKQRILNTKSEFNKRKNIFLQYLGISNQKFNMLYSLPALSYTVYKQLALKKAQEIAIAKRPSLQALEYSIKNIQLEQKYNNVSKYPKLDVNLYGVYDLKYKEGYKLSLDFNLPIERYIYRGKDEVFRKKILLLKSSKEILLRKLKTKIKNILQTIEFKQHAINLSDRELILAKQLEDIENKKYREGLSNLRFMNQREIYTLEIQKKLLQSFYDLNILQLILSREMGMI